MTRAWGIALAAVAAILLLTLAMAAPTGNPLDLLLRRDLTWQAMQQRGNWRVGMDPSFPPFELLDEAGQPAGFDVELASMLAEQWGLRAEIVAIGFDSLPDALRAGKIDSIISAYPYDERLTRDFAFSPPYFDAGLRLAVRAGTAITGVDGLAGQTVAVEWGSLGDMAGRQLQRTGLAVRLAPQETPADVVRALLADSTITAALLDNVTLRQAQAQGAALVPVGPFVESSPYVIVMPLRASQLQRQIAQTLSRLQSPSGPDGQSALAILEERWFRRMAPLDLPDVPMQ